MSSKLMPWACWNEWAYVGSCLNSGISEYAAGGCLQQCPKEAGPCQQSSGVGRVAAWRSRGRLPLAADITAALVEAKLREEQLICQQSSQSVLKAASDHALRMAYSLPIIRLVNGIADSQQRGRIAASVATLSNMAGLPPLLVDIRHDATHGELPSLVTLRMGSRLALEWLKLNYWDAQAHQLQSSHARIIQLLASLLGSCAAAAAKAVAPCPDALGGAEDESDGQEDDRQAGQPLEGAGGEGAGLGRLPGLDQLLPGLVAARLPAQVTAGNGSSAEHADAAPSRQAPLSASAAAAGPALLCSGGTRMGGYSAAQGRKHRKELLSQLRALVPPAWAHALVGPLLDAGAFPPPLAVQASKAAVAAAAPHDRTGVGSTHSPMICFGAPEGGPGGGGDKGGLEDALAMLEGRRGLPLAGGSGSGTPGSQHAGTLASAVAVAQKAWLAWLALVLKTYPPLGPALLQGCVHRLCQHTVACPAGCAPPTSPGGHPAAVISQAHEGGGWHSACCDSWWGQLAGACAPPQAGSGDAHGREGGAALAALGHVLPLYGWAHQLLGPPFPPPTLIGAGAGSKQPRASKQQQQQQQQQQGHPGSLAGPTLPCFHSALLSELQLVQLLAEVLCGSGQGSDARTDAGTGTQVAAALLSLPSSTRSAAAQECRRRLATRLASELQQRMLQTEGRAGVSSGAQGGVGSTRSAEAGHPCEDSVEGGKAPPMHAPPASLMRGKALLELAWQLLPHAAPHAIVGAAPLAKAGIREQVARQPSQQEEGTQQPHHPQGPAGGVLALGGSRTQSVPPSPADGDALLAAAAAQQAELLRRARSVACGQQHMCAPTAQASPPPSSAAEDRLHCGHSAGARPTVGALAPAHAQDATAAAGGHAQGSRKRLRAGGPCAAESGEAVQGREGAPGSGAAWAGCHAPVGRKRWGVAQQWLPCAIGCLPDPLQVGGRLPSLDSAWQAGEPAVLHPGQAGGVAGVEGNAEGEPCEPGGLQGERHADGREERGGAVWEDPGPGKAGSADWPGGQLTGSRDSQRSEGGYEGEEGHDEEVDQGLGALGRHAWLVGSQGLLQQAQTGIAYL